MCLDVTCSWNRYILKMNLPDGIGHSIFIENWGSHHVKRRPWLVTYIGSEYFYTTCGISRLLSKLWNPSHRCLFMSQYLIHFTTYLFYIIPEHTVRTLNRHLFCKIILHKYILSWFYATALFPAWMAREMLYKQCHKQVTSYDVHWCLNKPIRVAILPAPVLCHIYILPFCFLLTDIDRRSQLISAYG
jgi:hypothetical protein